MLSSSLFVVHNTSRSGQNDKAKLSGRQKVSGPFFDIANLDVKSWRNNSALVESSIQLNHNFPGSVVVNKLKLANVT